jgi:two-component system LytT family response regulator
MLKVILIDDEIFCLDVLEELITHYLPSFEIIGRFTDPHEGIKAILYHKPDVVLLDIEMTSLNGFDVIDKLKPFTFNVIFTTAHSDMALRAYRYDVKNYLVKPITLSDLQHALSLLFPEQDLGLKSTPNEKITVSTHDGVYLIAINEIIYCEAENSYCIIHLKDKKIIASKTLKDISEQLDEKQFLRIHHSYVVNKNFIAKYFRGEGGTVTMINNAELPISRSKREAFLNSIENY